MPKAYQTRAVVVSNANFIELTDSSSKKDETRVSQGTIQISGAASVVANGKPLKASKSKKSNNRATATGASRKTGR